MDVKPLFKGIDCISLKVDDLEKAINFYAGKLGHTLLWRTQTSAGLGFPNSKSELVLYLQKYASMASIRPQAFKKVVVQH